jgi:hypothetical protein
VGVRLGAAIAVTVGDGVEAAVGASAGQRLGIMTCGGDGGVARPPHAARSKVSTIKRRARERRHITDFRVVPK